MNTFCVSKSLAGFLLFMCDIVNYAVIAFKWNPYTLFDSFRRQFAFVFHYFAFCMFAFVMVLFVVFNLLVTTAFHASSLLFYL